MITEKLFIKTIQVALIHFDVSIEQKMVSVPDQFTETNYPKRTQIALKRLRKLGYHIQTSIKS
jgi:hypothetical protein